MNPELDTLATRLYVTIDDLLIDHPEWAPERPAIGISPMLSDAELITLAVIQALLGYTSEARFIRYAHTHLRPWFPYLPNRPGYNKRLRRCGHLMQHVIGHLARSCPSFTDDIWLVDSTPVECGRSRETAKRSDLVGWAEYGYCASHSRLFWGLRLHLITTPSGLPVAYALAGAKTDERDTALDMIAFSDLDRKGQTLIADKGYRRAAFETELNNAGITLIRPALKTEKPRPGRQALKAFRQIIESVNQTFKAQLDLERHGGEQPTPTLPHQGHQQGKGGVAPGGPCNKHATPDKRGRRFSSRSRIWLARRSRSASRTLVCPTVARAGRGAAPFGASPMGSSCFVIHLG